MSPDCHLLLADQGPCRVITLNRPQRRNALGTATMVQLSAALADAVADPDLRVLVLAGSPPAFCAGSDLKELSGLSPAAMAEHEAATAAVARSIAQLDLPVIAAVEGYALGGGAILALSCDLVVTASDARWALPEVSNGWLPPWGLEALVSRVGLMRAQALVWGAFDCDGDEAHRLGLADQVCQRGGAIDTALTLAARLAERPPEAVISTKRYFAQLRPDAEQLDATASHHFMQDVGSVASQTVLAGFSGRS
jgi:enoyl-CoA hydratase/carnithine racemase